MKRLIRILCRAADCRQMAQDHMAGGNLTRAKAYEAAETCLVQAFGSQCMSLQELLRATHGFETLL